MGNNVVGIKKVLPWIRRDKKRIGGGVLERRRTVFLSPHARTIQARIKNM